MGLAPTEAKISQEQLKILVESYEGNAKHIQRFGIRPNVGHKTAGVVMAQAFGVPAFQLTHTYTGCMVGPIEWDKCRED